MRDNVTNRISQFLSNYPTTYGAACSMEMVFGLWGLDKDISISTLPQNLPMCLPHILSLLDIHFAFVLRQTIISYNLLLVTESPGRQDKDTCEMGTSILVPSLLLPSSSFLFYPYIFNVTFLYILIIIVFRVNLVQGT